MGLLITLALVACGGSSDSGASLQVGKSTDSCAASTISVSSVGSGVSSVTFLIGDTVLGKDSNGNDGFSISVATRALSSALPESQLIGILESDGSETRLASPLSELTAGNDAVRLYPDVDTNLEAVTGFPFSDEFMEPLVAISNTGELCAESLLYPELVAEASGENLLYWETSNPDSDGVAGLLNLGIGCPDPNLCEPPAPIPLEELLGLISNWLGANVEAELTIAVSGAATNLVSQLEAQGRLLATLWRNIVEGFIYTDNYTSGRCDVNAKMAYPANTSITKGRAMTVRVGGFAGLARESVDSSNLFVVPMAGNEFGQCIIAENAAVSLVSNQGGATRQGVLRAGFYYELSGVPSGREYSLEVSLPGGDVVQAEISPADGLPVFRVIDFCPEISVQYSVDDSEDSISNISGSITGISAAMLSRVEVVEADNLETLANQVLSGDGTVSIDFASQFVPFKVAVFNRLGEVVYISATESGNTGGSIEVAATNEVTAIISGKANISLAQLTEIPELEGGAGLLPPEYLFDAGAGKVLTIIEAGGGISCCEDRDPIDPPGGRNIGFLGNLDIEPYLGVSGFEIGGVSTFLTGVFLNVRDINAEPPPDFDFSGVDLSFGLDFYPELNQLFFIGGGKTAFRNETQHFHVPEGATALYLGSLDAGGLNGPPGFFGDNQGSWTIKFKVE